MHKEEVMDKFSKSKRLIAIVMLLLGVASIDLLNAAYAADGRGRLSGQVEYNHVSPPAAGVKLLTQILDRVRSTPAFAMINKDKSLKKNEAANFNQLGISNYQLAIKPKESPRSNTVGSINAMSPSPMPSMLRLAKVSSADGASLMQANEMRGPGVHYYKSRSQMAIVNDSAPMQLNDLDAMESKADRQDMGNARARRKEVIALLPPNVATGIPLVRLGITQAEAGQSLKTWGSMREEVIGNWTIWSFQKPNSEEPLLQVFMRHGLVEALRIFDPNLVGHDLGVGLGDQVRLLKEQFGEPSFILSEPLPGAGQNYVYPLSQVAFLLSRPNPKSEPEVVSLLIFNVK